VLASGRGPPRLRLEEDINQFGECRVRPLVDLLLLHRADRMLHDQHRMIRRAERLFLGFCQRIESVRNQRHREPAALLQFDRVVDTPRRAGASISQAAQDEIRLGRQFVEVFFRCALLRRQFAP
jgi:hypothetical protein